LLKELIQGVANGREFETTTQPDYLSSYWPRLSTDVHGYIDWDWELPEIVRFTRAFSDPYDGAKTFVRGTEVRLKQCTDQYSDGTFHPFQTGILYRMHEDRAHIATTEGTLIAGRVLNEDGDSVLENLSVGDRLYTPTEQLERARKTRAFVTPTGTRHDTK
jgi:methionyl-tRNA formyltransferase